MSDVRLTCQECDKKFGADYDELATTLIDYNEHNRLIRCPACSAAHHKHQSFRRKLGRKNFTFTVRIENASDPSGVEPYLKSCLEEYRRDGWCGGVELEKNFEEDHFTAADEDFSDVAEWFREECESYVVDVVIHPDNLTHIERFGDRDIHLHFGEEGKGAGFSWKFRSTIKTDYVFAYLNLQLSLKRENANE